LLGELEIQKRVEWGQSRKDCGVFCYTQGWKPPVKKKWGDLALS
jgi:hypothetical protein